MFKSTKVDNDLEESILNKELLTINPDWVGNIKIDGEFVNFANKDKKFSLIDILKWKLLSHNPQADEKRSDKFQLQLVEGNNWLTSGEDVIVWLGHASFFIRLGGTTFITDPVFYNMSFIKRQVGIPCAVSSIKNINYILLSHGHRDHFDKKTISKLIASNPEVTALVPLNNGSYFKNKEVNFQEAGWYQKYETANQVEVYFMPSKHWNRRGLLDFNTTLWGSFIIKHNNITIYFAGDTAIGNHFSEIANIFQDIDYCILPIGAYKPANIMQEAHMSPREAYKAFKIMKARAFIPMHFGTYDLADEPLGEPQRMVESFNDSRIIILKVGEVFRL